MKICCSGPDYRNYFSLIPEVGSRSRRGIVLIIAWSSEMAIDVLILQPLVNNFYLISIRSVVVVVGIVLTGSTAFLAIDFAIA